MLNHPLVEAFTPWFLGEGFQIYNMSANISLRGESGIHMHKDQSSMPPDQIDFPYMLNALFYLTDLTPEKGATLIYPGSHLKNVAPLGHMSDTVSCYWSTDLVLGDKFLVPFADSVADYQLGRLNSCLRSRRDGPASRQSSMALHGR